MTPATEFYLQRVSLLEVELKKISKINLQFYFARLTFFLLTITFFILFIKYEMDPIYIGFSFLSILLFLIAITLNHRYLHKEKLVSFALDVNKQELEYLKLQFSDKASGDVFKSINPHLADDFDLFGKKSLYQFLNRCVTSVGKNIFSKGLVKATLDSDLILNRQKAIQNLSKNRPFVENFLSTGRFINENGDEVDNIKHWLNEKQEDQRSLKIITILLPSIMFAWIVLILFNILSFGSLVFPILINLFVIKHFNKKIFTT